MKDLIAEKICKEFPTPTDPLVVLEGASLTLSLGENVAIVGPSGSGKSTFLHILGTLDNPTSGTVTLGGQDPFELSEPELARFRNENIGIVFQDHHLLPQLTVLENTLTPALAQGSPSSSCIERARALIERVGLTDRVDHRPAELSGGERQRVAVARALIQHPKLLLADEPTGSLDRSTAREIGELLIEIQREEQTMLVVVTHSRELSDSMSQVMEIDSGRLVQQTNGG
ncbi:MAG: ABC transporter ATP-binding protein [Pirellulaceae bacterium]|nr:ABC transporter ATP-binding protein [Pirellulaceae bacterium]MDP7020433.1 ABC transporter ATP-binding protein [Pirellulaceae bacterium]